MKALFSMAERLHARLVRPLERASEPFQDKFGIGGRFQIEHRRDGKLIGIYNVKNTITKVGRDYALGVAFHDDTKIASWYMSLVDNSGFTAVSENDTGASHAGWNEFTTYTYSGGGVNRGLWGVGAASSQQVTNATPVTFDITGSGTIKGIFIIGSQAKGATTSTLWTAALFSAGVPVVNGDQLKITYTLSATAS